MREAHDFSSRAGPYVDTWPESPHENTRVTRAEEFYASLPFGPGEGPWKIKGVGYVFHDRYVAEHLPGGEAAQRAQLGALAEHPFWSQRRDASGSYDILPLVAYGFACADVMGMTMPEFVILRARHQAERDLTTMRRMVMSVLSPGMVARRFPFLIKSYFSFGEPDAESIDSGVRMSMRAVPKVLGPWLQATCHGFVEHTIETAGGKDIRIDPRITPAGTDQAGLPHIDLSLDMRWR